MIDISKYDCFLFDLYGTLIDLHTDEWAPKTWKKWIKWLDKNSIKHPEMTKFRRDFFTSDRAYRKKALQDGPYEVPEIDVIEVYDELFTRYGNKLSVDKLNELSWEFRKASTDYIRLYPGVEEYLNKLRSLGKKAMILSNAQASYTRPEILMFGLDKKVDDYFLSSDYKCMKPDVAYFNVAIDKHKLDKEKTIMIGDSASSDIAGATATGIDSFQIENGNLFLS